jgi:hypothetical protein
MNSQLGGRLRAARSARFVGRVAEKNLFQTALVAPELPFYILYIFGPGGIGKTALLSQLVALSQDASIPAYYLDVRSIDPDPLGFLDALRRTLGIGQQDSVAQHLAQMPRCVLLIDTYETLAPLDSWMRETFLPELPENTLVVMASRSPLSSGWRTDPGWQMLTRSLSLRNLEPSDARDYLARRAVPSDQHASILDFTYGHPLALSLVADVFAQRHDIQFQPESVPDVVKTLLAQFVQKVPGPAHRAALEVCPLVRMTTESLLADMLDTPDAHELFEWLSSLSFIEGGQEGIFPHDLAREALLVDLRWRNPEWYAELHRRARKHYLARLAQINGGAQQRVLLDYIFLHRDNPLVKPFFEWKMGGSFVTDVMQPSDMPALLQMVERHEGHLSARLASYWFSRQPDGVLVMRDARREPVGFVMMLSIGRITQLDLEADSALKASWDYLQNQVPLRPGEVATLFRFWMAADTYQVVSPLQSLIFVTIVRHYLTTPGLAYTFLPCADPNFWTNVFAYADLTRLPQADFTVEDRHYGMYGHDWRVVPPMAWLELLGERELTAFPEAMPPVPVEPVIVLSETEFTRAVQAALRDYTRPEVMGANPLLRSRLVIEQVGINGSESERMVALRTLIRETAESLQTAPRQAKFYRPLYHTYFQPAITQEQAAEVLDLPFSTYRRHLKSGIQRVTEVLWAREIGSLETEQKLSTF